MKLGFASDHRGFSLKRKLIEYFNSKDVECFDVGAFNGEKSDYPIYAFKLGEKVANKTYDFGVAICGSGIGISIASNKVKGVRAAKVDSRDDAVLARIDNDANIIAFGAETDLEEAKLWIETFINAEYPEVERHSRRIIQIRDYEEEANVE